MPLYEYGCEGCGHRLEVQQKLADPPLKTCPACGKDLLDKIISPTAFVLKGSGWYKDGYSGGKEGKKPRTDNQVTDRLQKAIDDDKKKSTPPASTGSSSSESSSTPAKPSGGGEGKSSAPAA